VLGIVFRLEGCPFPHAGMYSIQFWYNGNRVSEVSLRLRAR
jgi:hypothetical protein